MFGQRKMKLLIMCIVTFLAVSAQNEEMADLEELPFDPNENLSDIENANISEVIAGMYRDIYPKPHQWILIVMHIAVFVTGLVGNLMVVLAVYRNLSMRTVTNYFIVNLAAADLLVIICCLPPSIIWDITLTWFFGDVSCKVVLYLQTVSVTVSVLTLTFISIDRWYAICFPLRFKSTTSRAKTAIIIIWAMALIFDSPELVTMHTYSLIPKNDTLFSKTVLYTQCGMSWDTDNQRYFYIAKFVFLYMLPLIFMCIAYFQIVRVLWRKDIPGHNLSTRIINPNEPNLQSNVGNPEGQIKSRRKAAKMLVAVVLMFAACCLPVHLLSIVRTTIKLKSTTSVNVISCLVHWMFYANSAINPLIYNFMSGKFRREFKRTFGCPRAGGSHNRTVYRMAGMSKNYTLAGRSLQSTCNNFHTRSMHTSINNNNNLQHSTEIVPLSAVCPSSQQSDYHHAKHR